MLTIDHFISKPTEYDKCELSQAKDENVFMQISVDLFKELIHFIRLLSSLSQLDDNNNPRSWTRDEAILGGLMVRCYKLMIGYLDNICQKRMEIAGIIQRSLVETVINVDYLITNKSPELFQRFVAYSLRQEKQFLRDIENNISARGFEEPIETRMKDSINNSFAKSEISPEQVDLDDRSDWGAGRTIYDRFHKLGLKKLYRGFFGLQSHFVHGNWQEIMTHNLKYRNGLFEPNLKWYLPRPQSVLATGIVIGTISMHFLDSFVPVCSDKEKIRTKLQNLTERIIELDELHGDYCKKCMAEDKTTGSE